MSDLSDKTGRFKNDKTQTEKRRSQSQTQRSGRESGRYPATVQQQEKRGILSVRTAKRYAAALNCSWQEIMG